jgi:hypothetical protein
VKSSLKYWRTAARRNARMRSDPAALRRLDRENHDLLRAQNFQLRIELVKAQKAKAPAAAVHVGKKPWLPRREQTRGRPHGQKLRLLYMKYEYLRVASNVMNEVRAGGAARPRVQACCHCFRAYRNARCPTRCARTIRAEHAITHDDEEDSNDDDDDGDA